MSDHYILGKKGEQLAVEFLIDKNYTILEQNYRFNKAEVDIIAKKENILAVIEVKTRSTSEFGSPQDFVKPKQIKNLIKAVDAYVIEHDLSLEVRFDIIAIITKNGNHMIEHLEDAFYHF
jgi:putative endonuclease